MPMHMPIPSARALACALAATLAAGCASTAPRASNDTGDAALVVEVPEIARPAGETPAGNKARRGGGHARRLH